MPPDGVQVQGSHGVDRPVVVVVVAVDVGDAQSVRLPYRTGKGARRLGKRSPRNARTQVRNRSRAFDKSVKHVNRSLWYKTKCEVYCCYNGHGEVM